MVASPPPRRANVGTVGIDGAAADEFVRTALEEYERIASLCNAQSLLGKAAAAAPSSPATDPLDGRRRGGDERDLDPKCLTAELQRKKLYDSLSGYCGAIDGVRKAHASLKVQLSSMSKSLQDDDVIKSHRDGDGGERPQNSGGRRPPPTEAFSRHIELSERVIRTVTMQSSPRNKNGPCGVLFDNGIVRTSSATDREVNIVALASLRASVSQLKAS